MHQALYRSYRPKRFEDIVGQEHIVSVLKSQIREGSISHAYLFCGSRGTGKTSTAKVFSKAVNCLSEDKPCYQCKACVDGDLDEIELDAASNNSVDNIRDIRDNVVFMPTVGRYKVYIIDEVHMLSQGAFNALLKTLEEPPNHVIFILATTEPHKIPATVLSRCQRFDFKRLDDEVIAKHLRHVLEKEGKPFEEAALEFIARESDGGMRDALSLLDKTMSLEHVGLKEVLSLVGGSGEEEKRDFLRAMDASDIPRILELIEEIHATSSDIKLFVRGLLLYLRESLMEHYGIEAKDDFKDGYEIESLISRMEFFGETQAKMRMSSAPRETLELAVIRYLSQGEKTQVEESSGIRDLKKEIAMLREELLRLQAELKRLKESPAPETFGRGRRIKNSRIDAEPDLKELAQNCSDEEKERIEQANQAMLQVYDLLKQQRFASTKALLQEGRVARRIGGKLYIAYDEPFDFHKNKIDTEENRELISNLFSQALGEEVEVYFLFSSQVSNLDREEVEEEAVLQELRERFPGVPIEIK